jgi:uncharacterized GH25 family protein
VSDTNFSVPLGHDLEIIPLVNPAKITRGLFAPQARFKVLYQGQPLVGAEVGATYDYYNYQTPDAYAQKAVTDKNGEVRFKIDHGGLWFVRVSDTRPSQYPQTDEDNIAAIVGFRVK